MHIEIVREKMIKLNEVTYTLIVEVKGVHSPWEDV